MSIDQRARAGLQFLGSLQTYSYNALLSQARQEFEAQPDATAIQTEFGEDTDSDGWRQRLDDARELAERSIAYRFNRLYQRYVAEENWVRSIAGVERKRAHFEALQDAARPALDDPLLKLNPDLAIPDYYDGVEWHLQPGGLDGYDLTGPVAFAGFIPHVFSRGGFAAVAVGDDLLQQRRDVIAQFRKSSYRRIYDVGCGGAGTLGLCHERFPEAELIGGDLSAAALIGGLAFSQKQNLPIELRQEDGRATAEPDGNVDGVISYALHHELPSEVSYAILEEMFRILEPGGDIVISDPPPFRAVDPFHATLLDWETENRAEPYFTEACIFSLTKALTDIGFVDVEDYALQDTRYPWVTRGTKPTSN